MFTFSYWDRNKLYIMCVVFFVMQNLFSHFVHEKTLRISSLYCVTANSKRTSFTICELYYQVSYFFSTDVRVHVNSIFTVLKYSSIIVNLNLQLQFTWRYYNGLILMWLRMHIWSMCLAFWYNYSYCNKYNGLAFWYI